MLGTVDQVLLVSRGGIIHGSTGRMIVVRALQPRRKERSARALRVPGTNGTVVVVVVVGSVGVVAVAVAVAVAVVGVLLEHLGKIVVDRKM